MFEINLADAAIGAGAGGSLALGAFIGATRATLKYLKTTLDRIEKKVDKINGTVRGHETRLVQLESDHSKRP